MEHLARLAVQSLGWSLLLAGCLTPRPPTQATIYVDAQALVRSEARTIEVVILGGRRGQLAAVPEGELTFQAPLRFPMDFVLVPFEGDASRIFEVEATAYDSARRVITIARLRAGFVVGSPRTYRLTLEDACRGIVCGSGQTCRMGRCIELVDPDPDAGTGDLDAGPEPDAPPRICVTDRDCDDGNYCNGDEKCIERSCSPGTIVDCGDDVDCTEDVCMGDGCMHVPLDSVCTLGTGGRCDVSNGCQYDECNDRTCIPGPCQTARCAGPGMCVRESSCGGAEECCGDRCVALGCDDGVPCTDDFCGDDTSGARVCLHPPAAGTCDDGDLCTMAETCATGSCAGGTSVNCNDGNPCTRDSCLAASGCVNANDDTLPHDDGDACTVGDRCSGGVATPGTPMLCDDEIACTVDGCTAGTCGHNPLDARCTLMPGGICNPTAGCQYGPTCDAATCMPTDACEIATCVGPTCIRAPRCPGAICCAGVCCTDDSNPCTDTACMGGTCVQVNNAASCSDGDACTSGDTCSAGACVGSPTCPSSTNPCVMTTCSAGTCGSVSLPDGGACNDGVPCTTGDVCTGGLCAGSPRMCDDGQVCTSDSCNSVTGACVFSPAPPGTSCGGTSMATCTRRACSAAGICEDVSFCIDGEYCCGRSRCSFGGSCL